MRASIVIVGDEILIGQVVDTNSGEIARRLGPLGWEIARTTVVGDNAADILEAVEQALGLGDLVIVTGGLGPTKDDITKKTLAGYFGDGSMRLDADVLANVEVVFAKRGLQLNELTRSQAMVPTCCRVVQNELGTAPIMWFEAAGGKALVSMPGVPFECIGMLDKAVIPMLKARFFPDVEFLHHTVMATGITESDLAEKLAPFEESLPSCMHLAYLPTPGYIRLRLDCQIIHEGSGHDVFSAKIDELKRAVGCNLLYDGDATPAQILLETLKEKGLSLATAESCTGGNIGHLITSIPGSSECYAGGVICYSNDVKANVLGVNPKDISEQGAVSETVALQMTAGACRVAHADCSVGTT
ncbi:MAG: CinA family nicotinamide mononucleotide deamidase-related protein, partial [Lachnospiraceae bacterium]|nr:CinA family nicotinamide mononucleotide deamidase-related protein [Lachnospiraceae bacterium]